MNFSRWLPSARPEPSDRPCGRPGPCRALPRPGMSLGACREAAVRARLYMSSALPPGVACGAPLAIGPGESRGGRGARARRTCISVGTQLQHMRFFLFGRVSPCGVGAVTSQGRGFNSRTWRIFFAAAAAIPVRGISGLSPAGPQAVLRNLDHPLYRVAGALICLAAWRSHTSR